MLKLTEKAIKLSHNRRLIDTKHSIGRFFDKNRFNLEQRQEIISNIGLVANRLLDKIIYKHKEKPAYYGVHSLSTGIGFIVKLEKDYINDDGQLHLILVTLLPIKRFHQFKDDTIKVIVEKRLLNDLYNEHYKHLNENYRPDYISYEVSAYESFTITKLDENNIISDIDIFEVVN